jgi:hypothetical protein
MDGGREGDRDGGAPRTTNRCLPPSHPATSTPTTLPKQKKTLQPLEPFFFLFLKITGENSPKSEIKKTSNFKNELILEVSIARSEEKNSKIHQTSILWFLVYSRNIQRTIIQRFLFHIWFGL